MRGGGAFLKQELLPGTHKHWTITWYSLCAPHEGSLTTFRGSGCIRD